MASKLAPLVFLRVTETSIFRCFNLVPQLIPVLQFHRTDFTALPFHKSFHGLETADELGVGLCEGLLGIEASMLKLRGSDLAMKISDEAVQLHGGYGYCQDYRVERLMRDAKITQIWEGTNQIHRQLIGRHFAEKLK